MLGSETIRDLLVIYDWAKKRVPTQVIKTFFPMVRDAAPLLAAIITSDYHPDDERLRALFEKAEPSILAFVDAMEAWSNELEVKRASYEASNQ
jgi:hypothetical protein